jgi:hypothetical protein
MLFPITLLVIMAVAVPSLNGCTFSQNLDTRMKSSTDTPPTNSVIYYGSWTSYQIPFVPVEPISQEEAQKRIYWDNRKLKTRNMIKTDGSEINQNFDSNGNIMK